MFSNVTFRRIISF